MTSSIPLHIRLLNLLGAIRDLSPFDVMTAEEDELLRDLIVRWYDDKDISVGEMMNSMTGISATTAYRRLIGLRDKGLIQLRVDKADKRVKFIEPTSLSEDYAERISLALETVAKPA